MNDWELSVYIQEVINQAEIIELAAVDFNRTFQSSEKNSLGRTFMSIQSVLAAASMLSKLLWPNPASLAHGGGPLTDEEEVQRSRTLKRGTVLRGVLIKAGDDTKQLEANRTVRNAFEHFDERLDKFITETGGEQGIVDRNIAPLGSIIVDGGEPKHLRRINPASLVVSVLDSSVELQPLVSLTQTLKGRAQQWLKEERAGLST